MREKMGDFSYPHFPILAFWYQSSENLLVFVFTSFSLNLLKFACFYHLVETEWKKAKSRTWIVGIMIKLVRRAVRCVFCEVKFLQKTNKLGPIIVAITYHGFPLRS